MNLPHHIFKVLLIINLLFTPLFAIDKAVPQPKLSTVELRIREYKLTCEVARSPEAKAAGLMFRKELGLNEGMIFIADQSQRASFWMKNTSIPLSIAFIDPNGTILEIHDMKPFSEDVLLSESANVRFSLEVNQGWFSARKIKAGDTIQGISNLALP